MTLSIVIVSWNTAALLADCLHSIPAGKGAMDYEVIVVDNASTDATPAMVARDFPAVHLICNKANAGFGRANNQGLEASTGEFVLFLNGDTLVPERALERLVQFMKDHPRAGVCGPRLVRPDGSVQPFAFGGDPTPAYLVRRAWNRLVFNRALHDWTTDEVRQVDWVSGACLLARRTALEQVRGFDEGFFMYFEDNDLCRRMRLAGWEVFFNPHVSIIHVGSASIGQTGGPARWYDASLRHFFSRHYEIGARLSLELLLPLYRRLR